MFTSSYYFLEIESRGTILPLLIVLCIKSKKGVKDTFNYIQGDQNESTRIYFKFTCTTGAK